MCKDLDAVGILMRLFAVGLCLCAGSLAAEEWTVDSSSDSALTACSAAAADCSLRGAMTRANATPTADTIRFDIPISDSGYQALNDSWLIAVGATALPPIEAPVVIDGFTQPGATANTQSPVEGGLNSVLKIEIRGVSAARPQQNGFEISGNFFNQAASVFRGMAINSFGSQILLHGASAHRIEGCYLGTDTSGLTAVVQTLNGRGRGVRVQSGGPYQIGGLSPATRNLMGGLDSAIAIFATSDGLRIEGNLIGTTALGNAAIAIRDDAIISSAPLTNARIGGTDPAARNIISSAGFSAIRLGSGNANSYVGSRIEGNYFGTDVSGQLNLGNGGNPGSPSQTLSTVLLGGGAVCGLAIGGTGPGEANLIAYGRAAGLQADFCRSVSSPFNRYHANRGPALDNTFGGGAIGATPNDPGDADDGGNRLQNYPSFSFPSGFLPAGGSSAELSFQVDTAIANAAYPIRVSFYRAGCGGGSQAFIGSAEILESQAQIVRTETFALAVGNLLPITALAVDAAGNSSEFAPMIGDAILANGLEDQTAAPPPGSCQ